MRFPLLACCLLFAACTQRQEPLESRLSSIRSYSWPCDVVEPAPDWNPAKDRHKLIARCRGGFVVLEEGSSEQRFAAEDHHEVFFPRWLNADQAVFGPSQNVQHTTDGRILHASDGLTVVTLGEGKPLRRILADRGFMPKPDGSGLVWAQSLDHIIAIDGQGTVEDFGEGFDPEPQLNGPGLCWRDTPAFDHDWWTGRPAPGTMFVRWKAKTVDPVPGGMQATWTRRGGVIITIVKAAAPAGKPWWSAGTRLVLIPEPGASPILLRADVHDPQAHPLADLLAWVDEGGVWIGTIRADGWKERLAVAGSQPRWSADGLRLSWLEEPADAKQTTPSLNVAVLAPAR